MKIVQVFIGVCLLYTLWTSIQLIFHHESCNCPPQLNITKISPANYSGNINCPLLEQGKENETTVNPEDSTYSSNETDTHTTLESGPSEVSDIPNPSYPPLLFETEPDVESKTVKHICTYFSSNTKLPQSERIATIQSLLEILTSTLESLHIDHWITNGALLGSFRDQKIIPWDQDADIGITFESMISMLSTFSSMDFQWPCDDCTMIVRQGHHAHVIPFKFVNTTNGVYVDSFLFLRKDVNLPKKKVKKQFAFFWPESCAFCKDGYVTFDYEVVFPLNKTCVLEDRTYYCPNQTEAFLLRFYKHLRPTPPKGWKPPLIT